MRRSKANVHCARTSTTHPLQIAEIFPAAGYGSIGLTLCPGKWQPLAESGTWERDMVADVQAKAVLDKFLPGTTTHPSYKMFKAMTLRQIQPYSGGAITAAALADVERELSTIQ